MTQPSADSLPSAADGIPLDTRFGTFTAKREEVVEFADALPGFEGCRRFVLLSSPSLAPFTCLQGLEDSRPAFLVVSPKVIDAEYPQELSARDRSRLGATGRALLLWLAIVRLDGDEAYANLQAPIVVDTDRMRAVQVMDPIGRYRLDVPLLGDR